MLRHLLFLALVLVGCTSSPVAPTAASSRSALTTQETFELWKARYLSTDQVGRADLEAEGVQLAEQRREGFRALLLADPERAIQLAVSPVEREALPASVTRNLERWRDGIGTLHVIAGVGASDSPPSLERFVTFVGADEILRAGVFGERLQSGTRENVRLHGVSLDGAIAVTDRRLRRLLPGEARPDLPVEWPRACPVSRKQVIPDLVFHGGDTLYGFCTGMHADQYDTTLAFGETQTSADLGLPPASAWTEGPKTVLYVRVDFSDHVGDPVSQASAQSVIDTNVNNFYQSNSYGKTSLSTTVTPTLRLPRTQVDYQTNDQYLLLRSDALGAARDAGYDLNAYNLDIVAFASTYSGWAGRGYVGSRGTWLNGNFSLGVTAHELGHNYGVNHANFWNATGVTVIGAGTNTEYGNPFDVMGGGGGAANHFNAWFKQSFNWVVPAEIATVTSSGTYRIQELEKPVTSGLHAAKINRDAQKDYWVEYRPAINTPATRDGVSINWGYQYNTGSHLLDMTPGDGTRANSTLVIGRTFSDPLAGIHFTPVAKAGTTPEAIDVVINVGTFPGNRPPTLALAASTQTPAINQGVTFTATASDPDGDPLAYAWDFDDGTWGANAATVTKTFTTARDYAVRLVVSDMKGGTTSRTVVVTGGTPTTFTLSGTVLAGASPVEGVRITDGTRATFTSANGAFALTNVPAGSFTLTAAKTEFTFAHAFATPLVVSASQAGLDFTASPVAGYALSGKVSFGATNIAGVTVSDGTRTATTNATGDYVLSGVPSGRYTLTAHKPGWDLRPVGFTNPVEVFGGDVSALNYSASGQSLYGSIPIAGVTAAPVVTDGVRTVTATASGANWNWFLSAVPNGSWNVVATSPGVTLTPSSFINPVVVQGMSTGNLNFQVAAGASFLVQGTVRTGATPLPNVVVSDGTRSATTDSLGTFTLVGVPAGTWTITPALAGYTFVPASLPVTVSSTNLTGKDFTTTVVNLPPTIVTAVAATPSPVTSGTTTQLSVLAADDSGEPTLTYSWNVTGSWPVSFSATGSNAAKNSTVTFTGAGTYTFECVVTDAGGLSVRSSTVVQVQQVSTGLDITPANTTVATGGVQSFQATQRDQFNRAMFAGTPAWTVSGGGTIGAAGSVVQFTAGAVAGGPYQVTATVGARTAAALVTVAGTGAPTITAAASATPNPVPGATTQLSVRATDDMGEAELSYRWTASVAPAPVSFSRNGDNASKDVVATFTAAGDYEVLVTVTDGSGNTASSVLSVTVQATPTLLDLQPLTANVVEGQTQSFTATATDQFGATITPRPTFTWSIGNGGTVDSTGQFTAGAIAGGPFTLTVAAGTLSATAQVTVMTSPDTQPPMVSLVAPLPGSHLLGMTTLTATATDDLGVARVEFFADGTIALGATTTQPWTATFDAALLADGAHVLTARATDGAGNAATSDGVSIVVGAGPVDLSAPVVQILTPAPEENTPLVVAISVQATDDVGVTSVQLELDGSLVETLATAPWTKSLEVSAGAHSLVAIAADASGKTTRSAAVAFTSSGDVDPPGPVQPEKVIGGCGCSSADATPFHLAFLLVAFALRARRR